MRETLGKLICAAAEEDPNFIVLTGDHGQALFKEYRQRFPAQFLNCGIAEQAMIGIAAGLCREGYRPLVYGLAAFMPMRCLEQIKLDIVQSQMPVILVGDGGGTAYWSLGESHISPEDMAVLSPYEYKMALFEPHTIDGLTEKFSWARKLHGPSYIRLASYPKQKVQWVNRKPAQELPR